MTDTTLNVWLCKPCGEYNLLPDETCRHCHLAKDGTHVIHTISLNSPAAMELLGLTGKAPKNAAKGRKSGKSKASKRPTTEQLYKRVNWGEFANEIVFTVYGEPVAKQRPKFGRGGTYTPKKTKDYEALVRQTAQAAMHEIPPLQGLVQLSITVFRANGIRADIDNFVKSIMDGMNGTVYHDDSQVAELANVRLIRYASKEAVSITVREFAQNPVISRKGKAA